VVPKTLNIVGAGRDQTFLDGRNQEFVLFAQGGPAGTGNISVNLISLTVTGSGAGRTALVNVPDLVNKGPLPFLALSDVEVFNKFGTGVVNEGLASIGNGTRITNNSIRWFNGGGIFQACAASADGSVGGVSVAADVSIDTNTAFGTGGGIFLQSGTAFLQSASIVHDNSPNNCAGQDPNTTIPNYIN
jgi:hypothetical protein